MNLFTNKTLIQIVRNALTGWAVVGLQAVIGLFLVPFLIRHLGKEGFGVTGIIFAIVGFAEIADLGLRQALTRELAEKVATDDKEGFRQLSSSALVLYIVIALMIGGVGALFAPLLCSLFRIGDNYSSLVILLLRTYAPLTVLISFVTPVFTAGISSFMRYDVQNNVSMFSNLCTSVMLIVSLSLFDTNPIIIWCVVMAAGGLIRLGTMGILYRKICFGGCLRIKYVHLLNLVPLFKLGWSMYVLQLTRMLSQRADPLIISRFIGLAGVALYRAGSQLPHMVNPIVLAVVNQLTPLTTKYHVADNQKREQQVLILGTKYTLYLGAFFSVGMILLASPFCHIWLYDTLGSDVITVANVMKMWAVANLFAYAAGSQWSILLGKKKMMFAIAISVPSAIFNVILSVYLVGFTNLGVMGVLVGTVITEIFRRPIAIWYVSRLISLPLTRYISKAYVTSVFIFVLLLVGGYIFTIYVSICGWIGLIISGACLLAFAVVLITIFEWQIVCRILLSRIPAK